jgi:DNA-binding transcriptional ArsR family regulator
VKVSRLDGPPAGLPGSTEEWVRRFELLADPTRLRLLTHMHQHPDSPVGDLAEAAQITATAASQALRVLRDQGWVEARREGRLMRYRLVDDGAHDLLHFMGQAHGGAR